MPCRTHNRPVGTGRAAPGKVGDPGLGLVRLGHQPPGGKLRHRRGATSVILLGDAVETLVGLDIRLDPGAAAAMGSQKAHGLLRRGVRLKQQGMQRVETGGLALLVLGGQDIDAVLDRLDRNAPIGEAPDIPQSDRSDLHASYSRLRL